MWLKRWHCVGCRAFSNAGLFFEMACLEEETVLGGVPEIFGKGTVG